MPKPHQLPPEQVAARIIERQGAIMARWEALLKGAHPEIAGSGTSPLRNTLPEYLEWLAEAIRGGRASGGLTTIASQHGEQRTQLPDYSLEQLFTEYAILRRVVFEALQSSAEELDRTSRRRVVLSIEHALRQAATTFTDILVAREREATDAREQLLHIVAHDVRSPLQTLVTGVALLLEMVDDPGLREPLQRMDRAARAASRLINDLVDVAQIEAGGLAVVSSVQEAQSLLQQAADRHQLVTEDFEATVEIASRLPAGIAVLADADQLLRVFDNLIGNALRVTPSRGRVTLSACLHGESEACVRFTVADSGPGIPPQQLARLFDRFWQGPAPERSGVGLGLAISRGIVRAHGGQIWPENGPEGGAQFHFTIPRAAPVHTSRPVSVS